jgi:hypothetical protein
MSLHPLKASPTRSKRLQTAAAPLLLWGLGFPTPPVGAPAGLVFAATRKVLP